jgi:hypothetical protein
MMSISEKMALPVAAQVAAGMTLAAVNAGPPPPPAGQ